MSQYFKYTAAVVRGISSSLPQEALRENFESSVSLEKAKKQHDSYVNMLRDEIGLKVIELPKDDNLPDCVFVEDVAVVIGKKALITTPGHENRQGETYAMQQCLRDHGLELTIMKEQDREARLDGGDVLFTGEEIFVGISNRTNGAGCSVLAKTFPEFPVSSVAVTSGLHLKSFCSLMSPGVIVLAKKTAELQKMAQRLKSSAKKTYKFIEIDEDGIGANCLYIESNKLGPTVVHQPFDAYPESRKAYESLPGVQLISCDNSELTKVDGALTCCSILLN